MPNVDLSTIIYRAHTYGDDTPHPTDLGASGSGSKIRLQSIKFRAWVPRNFVDIIVEPPGGGNPGGPGVPPDENPGGPGGGGPPPGTSPPDEPPGGDDGGGGGSGGSGVPPTGGAIAGGGPNTGISDNFNNDDIHEETWDIVEETNGTITENNSQLEFNLTPTATDGSILIFRSDRFYSVYDSTWGFKVPVPGTSPTVWTFIFTGTGQGWGWNALTNTLTIYTINGGTQTFVLATAPLYYRIRHVPSAYQYPTPAVVDTHKTAVTADFAINLPNGIQIGDLLIVAVSAATSTTAFGWPIYGTASFTTLGSFIGSWQSLHNALTNPNRLEVGYYFVTSAAGFTGLNDTLTLSHASTINKTAFAYLIKGHSTTIPQATGTGSGGVNANPPSLTPTWGAENNLWMIFTSTGGVLPTVTSTGYTGVINDSTGTTVHTTAYKQLNAATEDPSTFTSASTNWQAATVAVRPATTAYYGIYYYEVSDDGINWTTLYSENATEAPGLGQFEITVTRPAGTGDDLVAFDDFFLERWYLRPVVKISVHPNAASATAQVIAPSVFPHSETVIVPLVFHAIATTFPYPSIINALPPGTIGAPVAIASALVGRISSATILISEVFSTATATETVPTIITTDGVVEKYIFHEAAEAIALVHFMRAFVAISEVVATAIASAIRPQFPPKAIVTVESVSIATASVATVALIGADKTRISPVALANASVDVPIPSLIQIKPTTVVATASVSTIVLKIAVLPILSNATAVIIASVPRIRVTITSNSTAIATVAIPLQLNDPNIIVVPIPNARALNSPSPRIVNAKPFAAAIASVTTPLLIGTTKIRIPPPAEAFTSDIIPPTILAVDALTSPEAEATASVIAPDVITDPRLVEEAIATASIVVPSVFISVTSVGAASASVSTPTPQIIVTSVASATAIVIAPVVDDGGTNATVISVIAIASGNTMTLPVSLTVSAYASSSANISVPTIVVVEDSEDQLAYPEDFIDALWAGNLQSFDDTMPHT